MSKKNCNCLARLSSPLYLIAHQPSCAIYGKLPKKLTQILDERQEDYGDAKDNFTAIGRTWGALLQIEDVPAYQVALMMVQFKTVRASKNPHKADSWDDLEGYAHHGRDLIPEKDGE